MKTLMLAGFLIGSAVAYGQQQKANAVLDSLRKERDTVTLQQKLKQLGNGSEKDLIVVMNYYQYNKERTDSVVNLILQRFPKGNFAFYKDQRDLYKEEDAEKREKLLIKLKEKFPGRNLNLAYYAISSGYIKNRNLVKLQEYINQIEDPSSKGMLRAFDAREIMVYDAAAADAILKPEIERLAKDGVPQQTASKERYYTFLNLYGNILVKEKKYQDALKYVMETYEHYPQRDDQLVGNYGLVLNKNGRHQEALPALEKLIDKGKPSAEIKSAFVESYEKVNPGKKAADYLHNVDLALKAKTEAAVAKSLINEPSPDFEIKDIHGKKVSLADFKGKTIVLDFWATWCVPCKASFPSMQRIVNHYKNDPDVKFLFVHTRETIPDPLTDARKYLSDNHYNFDLYMDLKDPKTKKNNAVTAFGAKGIPAKFVIDGKGNIRFKVIGFSGDEDDTVSEISTMIDLARKNL